MKFATKDGIQNIIKLFQYKKDREAEDKRFAQQLGFNEKELSLLDIARKREQDFREESFQKEFTNKLDQQRVENQIARDNFGLNERKTNIDEQQGNKRLSLMELAQNQDYEIGKANLGLGYSRIAEDKRQFDTILPWKQFAAETDRMKAQAGQKDKFNEYYSEAAGALSKLKAYEEAGGDAPKDYETYKGQATEKVYKTLGAAGVTQEDLNKLRSVLGDEDDPETKRQLLDAAINEYSREKKWGEKQIKAAKLWSQIGTR